MADTDTTYNGWTNKATWLVKLWIDNDQGEQEGWLEQARDQLAVAEEGDNFYTHEQYAITGLAEQLQNSYEDMISEHTVITGFVADLMSWALAMVNWDEVAKSLIEDAAEVNA